MDNEKKEFSKRDLVVYVSGKYTTGDVEANIAAARNTAIDIWNGGYVALCPHLNMQHFDRDSKCEYEEFMKGSLVLLDKSGAIFMLEGWEDSPGAKIELEHAISHRIAVVFNMEQLDALYEVVELGMSLALTYGAPWLIPNEESKKVSEKSNAYLSLLPKGIADRLVLNDEINLDDILEKEVVTIPGEGSIKEE